MEVSLFDVIIGIDMDWVSFSVDGMFRFFRMLF